MAQTDANRHLSLFCRSQVGGGGAERVILNIARRLSERGHRVDLVMARAEGRFLDQIPPRVRLVDLKAVAAVRVLPTLPRIPGAMKHVSALAGPSAPRVLGSVPAFARYLRRERPDAVLSALNYTNLAALFARRLAGTRTRSVISVHNHLSASLAHSVEPRLRAVPELARTYFPEADEIVAVSRGVADDLARVTGIRRERITTVYNPVVTPDLRELAEETPTHPWLRGGEGSPPVILAVGKLKPQKDFPTLLRAFARVRAERAARLVVLGEGPELNALREFARTLGIEQDVDFPGFVDNPFALMSRAGVFVLSSAWEGFGNVLVEAMACGCPVISTDCPSGPSEILDDGRYGSLVKVGDSDTLAREILRALDAPVDRKALRERAARFGDERSARLYEGLLLGRSVEDESP